jgi:hypothetical protein
LHAGWWFAQRLLTQFGLTEAAADPTFSRSLPVHGLLPVAAVLLAGVLAHILTATPAGEDAAASP